MADGNRQAEIKTDYPVTSGLDADSKHKGRQINLVPEGHLGRKSTVLVRDREGME